MSTTYVAPTLTVDAVIFQLLNDQLAVLLIQRQHEPFKGAWALPGGYNPSGETTSEAFERVLQTKAGLAVADLRLTEQLYTFDTVARDPRGHAVSVTYLGVGKDLVPAASSTTQNPQFFLLNQLPASLAYDHGQIITYARQRLQAKLSYTNAVFALLPALFTLSQLQVVYEAVIGRSLDKRNFRKKFLGLGLIQPSSEFFQQGAHRPARLYKFNRQALQTLERSFD